VKTRIGAIAKWTLWGLAVVVILAGLYLSLFFFPYPLFPHHIEHAGFDVYSDREIPEDFERVLEDARRRMEAMELYRGEPPVRIFKCQSQRRFVLIVKMAGKPHVGQGLLVSVAGNAFFSDTMIRTVGQRNGGRPAHSRLEGSWAAAIAHEVAHHLVFAEVGFREARRLAVWKSEGYADYQANLASAHADPDYDLRSRIEFLLDDESWRSSTAFVDRRHFRWHVVVEYLCAVEGLGFRDLMDSSVTEESARARMTAWYSSPEAGYSILDTRSAHPPLDNRAR
jgi:hypothetical protein